MKLSAVASRLTGLKLLPGLSTGNLAGELMAGITLVTIAIPLNIGYAQIAGLPPIAGLYALIIPTVIYALVVSSRQLVASPDGDEAVIRVEQLPTLPGDQAFQLWLVDAAGTVTSGGVFNRQGDADATFIRVPLEQPLDAYQRFGVSIEPAGGSPFPDRPTGPRVFSVQLS